MCLFVSQSIPSASNKISLFTVSDGGGAPSVMSLGFQPSLFDANIWAVHSVGHVMSKSQTKQRAIVAIDTSMWMR